MAHFSSTHEGLRELALFAGAGGGILGGHLLGWRTVCAVEWEPYPAAVLAQRQNDGILAPFPIWDDVRTFDGRPWRGIVDVVSGGFPCQDISAAGPKTGITGERSGLWKQFERIIGEVRPRLVLVENSPDLTIRGIDIVLGDLAKLGFDAKWGIVSAADAGAPHRRERVWIFASNSEGVDVEKQTVQNQEARSVLKPRRHSKSFGQLQTFSWGVDQPRMDRVDDERSDWVDRSKALGNAQIPIVAREAVEVLS